MPMPSRHCLAAMMCLSLTAASSAQERTPTQQTLAAARHTINSPFAAGGPTEAVARSLAEGLSARYGQPAVVESLAGAAGDIGMDCAERAKPNSHTLLLVPAGNITNKPSLMPDFALDIERDLTAITMLAATPNVLVANPKAVIGSVQDLLAQANAIPERLSDASSGVGSGLHLVAEFFKHKAGIDILHLAYRGTGPAVNDAIGGVVPSMFSSLLAALPSMQVGTLQALATTSAERSPMAPELVTLQELGVPEVDLTSWYGLFGPDAMPVNPAEPLARYPAEMINRSAAFERPRLQGMRQAT